MRDTKQRTAAVKQRAAALLRRRHRRMAAAGTACLALITALALAMPGILSDTDSVYTAPHMAASIFSGGSGGYILVGLLAFALGVSVTVLCVRLHRRDEEQESDDA